ncbi:MULTISPECIES: helix-turn-helix domain-containing protein [Aneurinibacillus]|jgi:transcriptional regulator with XRE-family HTH domain|uniref:helix-turn-helix domain-containing protein n=1 Tax=Aneurinibacillus TaxID=55079 RepID=UPI00209E8281|nr:helix-turn-helix transcriptional regulator [Aneurinibacillus migulanus]MCP1354610.1 helix-turn-helix domain-containing protein [Aneurinibacillus migulanus]
MYRLEVRRCLLRNRLREYGLRQQDLADRLGMPRSQVSDYATGRRMMTIETAASIANAIGCTIDDLYEFKPIDSE